VCARVYVCVRARAQKQSYLFNAFTLIYFVSNAHDNIAQTLHEMSRELLLASSPPPVPTLKSLQAFSHAKMRSISSHETEGSHLLRIVNVPYTIVVIHLRNRTGRYPRWSRVWPLSLIPLSPPHPNTWGSTDSPFTLARSHVSWRSLFHNLGKVISSSRHEDASLPFASLLLSLFGPPSLPPSPD